MTEVAFYFNAHDKWDYTCRLLRKAVHKGSRVAVTGEPSLLQQLDRDLWAFSATEFVPHCVAPCAEHVAAASPIVFCSSPEMAAHQQVLLNIGVGVPAGFERFERLIEVVGNGEADRLDSRQRWKHYRDRGYAITRHDLAPKESH